MHFVKRNNVFFIDARYAHFLSYSVFSISNCHSPFLYQPKECATSATENATKVINKMKDNFNALGDWFDEHEKAWRKSP